VWFGIILALGLNSVVIGKGSNLKEECGETGESNAEYRYGASIVAFLAILVSIISIPSLKVRKSPSVPSVPSLPFLPPFPFFLVPSLSVPSRSFSSLPFYYFLPLFLSVISFRHFFPSFPSFFDPIVEGGPSASSPPPLPPPPRPNF
jgi:hypothetical protein